MWVSAGTPGGASEDRLTSYDDDAGHGWLEGAGVDGRREVGDGRKEELRETRRGQRFVEPGRADWLAKRGLEASLPEAAG